MLVVGAMLRIHYMVLEVRPDEWRVFSGPWDMNWGKRMTRG